MNTKTPGQILFERLYPSWQTWESCLSQESHESAAAAVIAHHEASKEPQPKFKVGDRIRRKCCPQQWVPLGFEATVLPGDCYIDGTGSISDIYFDNWDKVEWTLPEPPPGREWHRQDFTAEMLPDGWRPCLVGEGGSYEHSKDGVIWNNGCFPSITFEVNDLCYMRTRRPLPPTHEIKIELPPLTLTSGKLSLAAI